METPRSILPDELKPYLAMAISLEENRAAHAKTATRSPRSCLDLSSSNGSNYYRNPPSNKFYQTQYEYHGDGKH